MENEKIQVGSIAELFEETEKNGFYNDQYKLPPAKGERIIKRQPEQFWRLIFADSPEQGMNPEIGMRCYKWEEFKLGSQDEIQAYLELAQEEKFAQGINFKVVLPPDWKNKYVSKMYAVIFYTDQYVMISQLLAGTQIPPILSEMGTMIKNPGLISYPAPDSKPDENNQYRFSYKDNPEMYFKIEFDGGLVRYWYVTKLDKEEKKDSVKGEEIYNVFRTWLRSV